MRLDPDLIRGLLLEVEGEDKPDLSAWSEEAQLYHLAQLIDADLLKGKTLHGESCQIVHAQAEDLTWEGHEFLANLRNEQLWPQVKEKVANAGGSVSLAILCALAAAEAKRRFGLP